MAEKISHFNRESLEAALPNMAARAVEPVIATYMSRQEPLRPPAEISIGVGPQCKVKVISDRNFLFRRGH